MGSADVKGPACSGDLRAAEARAALDRSLAQQRETALGKRVVNTQGPASIALADEKYRRDDDEDTQGWMA